MSESPLRVLLFTSITRYGNLQYCFIKSRIKLSAPLSVYMRALNIVHVCVLKWQKALNQNSFHLNIENIFGKADILKFVRKQLLFFAYVLMR